MAPRRSDCAGDAGGRQLRVVFRGPGPERERRTQRVSRVVSAFSVAGVQVKTDTTAGIGLCPPFPFARRGTNAARKSLRELCAAFLPAPRRPRKTVVYEGTGP